jgi:hypothetical protein
MRSYKMIKVLKHVMNNGVSMVEIEEKAWYGPSRLTRYYRSIQQPIWVSDSGSCCSYDINAAISAFILAEKFKQAPEPAKVVHPPKSD